MSNDFETPRPFPEDKEGQINWYENEIQRWHLRTAYVIPESNAPLNGPIVPNADVPVAPPSKEEVIERLTADLEALRNS
jgi:hypothetical protein